MKKKLSFLVLFVVCVTACVMGLTACGGHKHSYEKEWSYDETHHWHACKKEECEEKADYAEHKFQNGVCACGKREYTEGLLYKLSSDGSSYLVNGVGTATDLNIVIASRYEGKPVTGIAASAFKGRELITGVTIPNTVTRIGDVAFEDCKSLVNVSIPNSVTRLDNSVFKNCSSLKKITIPNSVTYLGNSVFLDCSALNSVTLPSSLQTVGLNLFAGCTALKSITLPEGLKEVAGNMFGACTALTDVVIPVSATKIDSYAFYGCTALTEISIPASVTNIGSYAFSRCTNLKEFTFKGTKEQWTAMRKGNYWNEKLGKYTVHCSDGDLEERGAF